MNKNFRKNDTTKECVVTPRTLKLNGKNVMNYLNIYLTIIGVYVICLSRKHASDVVKKITLSGGT